MLPPTLKTRSQLQTAYCPKTIRRSILPVKARRLLHKSIETRCRSPLIWCALVPAGTPTEPPGDAKANPICLKINGCGPKRLALFEHSTSEQVEIDARKNIGHANASTDTVLTDIWQQGANVIDAGLGRNSTDRRRRRGPRCIFDKGVTSAKPDAAISGVLEPGLHRQLIIPQTSPEVGIRPLHVLQVD